MIARALLGFLPLFVTFAGLAWVVFRTNLVTRGVVKEAAKTGSLLTISAFLAAAVVGLLIAAERYL